MVKRWIYGLLLIFLVVAAWFLMSRLELDNLAETRTEIRLSYQAEKEFEPEEAVLILGVETTSQDLEQAFSENNTKIEGVTAILNEMEQLSLTTLNFQVNPRTRVENENEIVYYNVLNQIEVRTDDLVKLGNIIQEAVAAGANQVLSINYTLKNPEQAKKSVIAEAIDGIRNKADFLVKELNGEDYKLVSMDMNDQYQLRDYTRYRLEAAPQNMADTALPPISPQKIRVTVNLMATISLF